MKRFAQPWLWGGLWVLGVAAIVVLSLGAPPPAPDVPASDKWMHLAAYATAAVGAVQVFRPGGSLVAVCLGLALLGVGLEIGQGTLTADRTMDYRDALANALGVVLGGASAALPGRDLVLTLERLVTLRP